MNIMHTKEEVIIDEDMMEELEEISIEVGRSLQEVIECYVDFTIQRRNKPVELSTWLASLRGKYKIPADLDFKGDVRAEALYKKYNRYDISKSVA
jgi:hypothetical protein